MRYFYPVLLLLLLLLLSCSDNCNDSGMDCELFNKNLATAKWLVEYHNVATKTGHAFDVLNNHFDKEFYWFCFKESNRNNWHTLYGYIQDSFNIVRHFVLDKNQVLRRSDSVILQKFTHDYVRAIMFSRQDLAGDRTLNYAVLRNEDSSFSVWAYPQNYTTNSIENVNNRGYYFKRDGSGRQQLERKDFSSYITHISDEYSVVMHYEDEQPSWYAIFTALSFSKLFSEVSIYTETYISNLSTLTDGRQVWEHKKQESTL